MMMKRYITTLLLVLTAATSAWAKPTDDMVHNLSGSVLRVTVNLPDGKHGFGSAVVVAKNEVITNCHVVTNASDVSVIVNGEPHKATAIKADWHHDLCMLTVENLEVPAVKLGASKALRYKDSIFTIGYPDAVKTPVSTFGVVKGLFPMDDSVVIRATSPFRLGASGGGAFDDAGNLVGVITLKSRGEHAQYFYMPVEWVQALMTKPAKSLGVESAKPFWAMDAQQRPYFMRVVQPYVSQEWKTLLKVAAQWVQSEPNTAESWFYLATAEYGTKDYVSAEAHFRKVLALNHQHSEAMDYLDKLAEKVAETDSAKKHLALLN